MELSRTVKVSTAVAMTATAVGVTGHATAARPAVRPIELEFVGHPGRAGEDVGAGNGGDPCPPASGRSAYIDDHSSRSRASKAEAHDMCGSLTEDVVVPLIA